MQFIGSIGDVLAEPVLRQNLADSSSFDPSQKCSFDRGNHYEFLCSSSKELARAGRTAAPADVSLFRFGVNVEKQYESYNGINVKLRYYVRHRRVAAWPTSSARRTSWVYSYRIPPEMNSPTKTDVGIEDCLHIEFEYSKSKYHLKDVIVAGHTFYLVRLKIKHMELSISGGRRRAPRRTELQRERDAGESSEVGPGRSVLPCGPDADGTKIMDGSPSRGETIPIRL